MRNFEDDFRIGRYSVSAELSESPGYRDFDARHDVMGQPVLLRQEKWASGKNEDPDRQLHLRALGRARRLQAEIRHPRILKVLDFFEVDGEWFTVFERDGSASLRTWVQEIDAGKRRHFSIDEYLRICSGLTDALAAIHRAGFVHRTLGVHDVLVTDECEAIMTDLGCAIAIGADDAEIQIARGLLNPSTAAPEQFEHSMRFTPATDLWSLGAILFFARYGGFPYRRTGDASLAALAFSVLHAPLIFPPRQVGNVAEHPPRLSVVADSAGSADEEERLLQGWLGRLLERDPNLRYGDAEAVRRDLEAIVAQLESRPRRATAFVAMPFDPALDGLWRMIMSASWACRVRPVRVDQAVINESIWDEIRDQIEKSDLMIAVASPHRGGVPNANVMMEIGYFRALRRPVVLLTSDPTTLPFDLRTQRAIVYRPDAEHEPKLHRELCELLDALTSASAAQPR
jgi:hypothetical protein